MEKYIIRKNVDSKYGYDLVIVSEEGSETVKELTSKTTDGYLRLPENPLGQKMIALKKLETHNGDYELEKYEGRHTSNKDSSNSSTKKEDFLNALALCLSDEERKTFNELCEKALSRFEVFKKKEMLKKQIAEMQAKLKELKD